MPSVRQHFETAEWLINWHIQEPLIRPRAEVQAALEICRAALVPCEMFEIVIQEALAKLSEHPWGTSGPDYWTRTRWLNVKGAYRDAFKGVPEDLIREAFRCVLLRPLSFFPATPGVVKLEIASDLQERRDLFRKAERALRVCEDPSRFEPPSEADKAAVERVVKQALKELSEHEKQAMARRPEVLPAADAMRRRPQFEPLSPEERNEVRAGSVRTCAGMGGVVPRVEKARRRRRRRWG
jgi:hypothetical protein